jgi:hypothetical protein
MMFLLLTGCWAQLEPTALPPDFEYIDPVIETIEWNCNADESEWSFVISTIGWTGNGNIWISRDDLTEKHRIYSTEAARDGSQDLLELELAISADWQDAQSGKSTRWRCQDQDTLSFMAIVYHPEDFSESDCRFWGQDIWADIEGAPDCDQPLEE